MADHHNNLTGELVKRLGPDLSNEVVAWLKGLLIEARIEHQKTDDLYPMLRAQGVARRLERMILDISTVVNAKPTTKRPA